MLWPVAKSRETRPGRGTQKRSTSARRNQDLSRKFVTVQQAKTRDEKTEPPESTRRIPSAENEKNIYCSRWEPDPAHGTTGWETGKRLRSGKLNLRRQERAQPAMRSSEENETNTSAQNSPQPKQNGGGKRKNLSAPKLA
jgi:hypothetical protein